jgi:imidazolonepropionase-like amidohydrolase
MRIVKVGLLACLALAAVVVVAAQRPALIVLEGARLIIGDGRVIENGALVVDNGRITRVGRMGEVQRPAGATRVDLTGKTVMPTLIDAHMHMGFENMHSWAAKNYTRENVIDTLDRLAYYGVGAVFSTGTDPDDLALQIQQEQAAGKIGGARFIFAAGAGPPGAGPNANLLKELATLGRPVVHGITNEADARQAVRQIAAKKISFIKVWVTNRGGTQQKTTPEAYRGLIDEAHKHNIRVVAHATDGLEDAKDLARAGLDGYIHGVLDADAEFVSMVKKNNAFITPAQGLGLRGNVPGLQPWFEDPFFQEATPPATIERYRQQAAKAKPPAPDAPTVDERLRRAGRMIKVLLDGGVRVAVGTDAGATPDYPPGYPTHREMELYAKAGMTPQQVIVAATKSGAEALGLDKELGTLEAGKIANLLVLNADPLADITNTRKVASVYIQGRELDRTAMRRKWNPTGTK